MDVAVKGYQGVISQKVVGSAFHLHACSLDVDAKVLHLGHELPVPGSSDSLEVEAACLFDALPAYLGLRNGKVDKHLGNPSRLLVEIAVAMAVRRNQGICLEFLQDREIVS